MKKIIFIFALLLSITLISCGNGSKIDAKIENVNIVAARSSVYIGFEVKDEKEEITKGTITGRVLLEGEEVSSVSAVAIYETDEEDETTDIIVGYKLEFTGLKVGVQYNVEIHVTSNKKLYVLHKDVFSTTTEGANSSNPKRISTIADYLNIPLDSSAYYQLENDLDFEGKEYPLFFQSSNFTGHFDGNGKAIKNVTIEARRTYTSLFGRITGTISNLTVENMNITLVGTNKHSQYISFVVGRNSGNIDNVHVINSHITTEFTYTGKIYVGGLAAYSDSNSKVTKSTVKETAMELTSITRTEMHLGGLIGYMTQAKLEESEAALDFKINNSYKGYFGGAVGYVTTTSSPSSISRVTATSEITLNTVVRTIGKTSGGNPEAMEIAVGGLVGKIVSGSVKESIAVSDILVKSIKNIATDNPNNDKYLVGGVAGLAVNNSSFDNVYYDFTFDSDVLEENLVDLFDMIYVGGLMGENYLNSSIITKGSGKVAASLQAISPSLRISPNIGASFLGDFFESTIHYDGQDYIDTALFIKETITETDLDPVSISEYYTSDYIKTFLDK